MAIPITSRFFPHTILVYPPTYTNDPSGGSVRSDGTAVSMAANVQSEGAERVVMMSADEGNAVTGEQYYDVSTATDPGVQANQTIVWKGRTLICVDAASEVFRGRLYRTRCVVRT